MINIILYLNCKFYGSNTISKMKLFIYKLIVLISSDFRKFIIQIYINSLRMHMKYISVLETARLSD